MKTKTPSEIIDALGGTAEVSRLCEVEMAAVSQWRNNGIPNARLMFLRLACPKADWKSFCAVVSKPIKKPRNRRAPTDQPA